MARRPELAIYDWVRPRDFELVALGEDPSDRIRFTGHTRCLSEPYLSTIGTWGAYEVHEMVNNAEPHRAAVQVSEAAYRRFKARHRLLCRKQFARVHGPQPWRRAELCHAAHAAAQNTFGTLAPIGVACDYARATLTRIGRSRNLGILNVEIVLWTLVFDALLTQHGLTTGDWVTLGDEEKAIVWHLGCCHQTPWSVDAFLHGPAVRGLPSLELPLAS